MYRNGEYPQNYYQNQQQVSEWYWDGKQYQYYKPEEIAKPPDIVAIPNEGEDTRAEVDNPVGVTAVAAAGAALPPPPPPLVVGTTTVAAAPAPSGAVATTHAEHYAFYEKQLDAQLQQPDVLQRGGDPPVPSSDRNLFMETGHLDAVDVGMDRLVLGENEDTRFVPGISSTDQQLLQQQQQGEPRSEAVGADRRDDSILLPSSTTLRNVEGGGGEKQLPSNDEEVKEEEDRRDEEEEEEDIEEEEIECGADDTKEHHYRQRKERSSASKKNHRPPRKEKRRDYSPQDDQKHSHRRRDDRRTVSPSSDEYQRSSRRSSHRYPDKYNGGHRGDSYYYNDRQSSRHNRSYAEDSDRRKGHRNRSYYDYSSRPSSKASNYDFEYARSRRHYPQDSYYSNMYPPQAPMPDPVILESFRKNWEYYSRNPAHMESLRLSNPAQHSTLLRYYQMYSHLLPAVEPQRQQQLSAELHQNEQRPLSRTSVHSGQSSIAENFSQKFHRSSPSAPHANDGEQSTIFQPNVSEKTAVLNETDITPLKYTTPHVKGSFGANGTFICLNAKNPVFGQSASVDLIPLQKQLAEDVPNHHKNLADFPGPLIPGRTHKGEVIRYCKNKISSASSRRDIVDKDSYVLLWELLILLLRQKNAIDGSDIAELLLKNRPVQSSLTSSCKTERKETSDDDEAEIECSSNGLNSDNDTKNGLITAKFRDYLLFGHKKEGLEYAMTHGLWGHALFLASKMDERSYSNVMLRFANGIAVNDPIQTLYQQMSGRQPIAMKECADANWGDWRPHLAMILSNPSQKHGLDHKSIVTLGDTLYEKGYLFASQFCYLMVNLEFSSYNCGTSSKLVLLGADHLTTNFRAFTSNAEAVQCTEIFEYIQKLSNSEHYCMSSFIFYKYLYAIRLLDFGFSSTALHYLEVIADALSKRLNEELPIQCDFLHQDEFVKQVLVMADRLKYLDPKYTTAEGEKLEIGDPDWISSLRNVTEFFLGEVRQKPEQNYPQGYFKEEFQTEAPPEEEQPTYQQVEYNGQMYYFDHSTGQYYLMQNEEQSPTVQNELPVASVETHAPAPFTASSSVDTNDAPPMMKPIMEESTPLKSQEELSKEQMQMPPALTTPQPNAKTEKVSNLSPVKPGKIENKSVSKENIKAKPSAGGSGSGLLGRLLGKLAMPPNQVHLPDDKDGTIVWDESKKRWVDSNAVPEEEAASNAPPPSDTELLSINNSMPSVNGSIGNNRFSGRGLKGLRGRVDIFKNSMSAPSLSTMALPSPIEAVAPIPLQPQALQDDAPNQPPPVPETTYEVKDPETEARPLFFDPSQFSNSLVGTTRRNKYT